MKIMRRLLSRLSKFIGATPEASPVEIDFHKLEKVLRYSIHNKQYFREALSHRSYLQLSTDEAANSNERLEFLGDSVLNLVVGEYLFHREPNAEEGELTKIRSRFVNRKAASIYARDMQLMDFLLVGPHIMQIPGRGMETILSDGFEAIVGAIYLDGGYHQAKQFIERCVATAIENKTIQLEDENFKSQLLEQSQANGLGIPRYITMHEVGPDHDRTFTVDVLIGQISYGTGVGKNKKDAEQAAAEKALRQLNRSGESHEDIN
jgi:ribonuclease-3